MRPWRSGHRLTSLPDIDAVMTVFLDEIFFSSFRRLEADAPCLEAASGLAIVMN